MASQPIRTKSIRPQHASVLLGGFLLAACSSQGSAPPPATPVGPAGSPNPATAMVAPPPAAAPAGPVQAPPPPAAEPPVVLKDVGFKTPESVLYDPEQDVYFVSNVDGKPDGADGNGFISKVSPEGKVLALKWVDGSKKGSTLNAPKGLAVSGPYLYVADLTFVRIFDRKTGAPKGKIAAAGSTFLNDVTVAPDGTIYVSDSGLKVGKDGLEPTGSDAIYKIGKAGRADKLAATPELNRPNGVLADEKGLWVATAGSGALYHMGLDGKRDPEQKLPGGGPDGLVRLADGSVLVSSWANSAVYRGVPGGTFEAIIHDVKSPADIGFDTKRNVVLIPLFQLDAVALARLPGGAPPAAGPVAAPAAGPAAAPPGPVAKSATPAAAPVPLAPGATPAAAPAVAPHAGPAPAAQPIATASFPPPPSAGAPAPRGTSASVPAPGPKTAPPPPAAAPPPGAGAKPGTAPVAPPPAPPAPAARPTPAAPPPAAPPPATRPAPPAPR